tara:strand:+ start:1360 stop:2736 length:1377 start_codon:yes stop_codon:yes gene_type:complete
MSGIMMTLLGASGGASVGGYFCISRASGSPWADASKCQAIATDSENNTYILVGIGSNSSINGGLIKTDKDGTVQWDTGLQTYNTSSDRHDGLKVDSQDRPHVASIYGPSGERTISLQCLNPSTGAREFYKTYSDPQYYAGSGAQPYELTFNHLGMDSNDRFYMAYGYYSSSSRNRNVSFVCTAGSSSYTHKNIALISPDYTSGNARTHAVSALESSKDFSAYYYNGRNEYVWMSYDPDASEASAAGFKYNVGSVGAPFIDSSGNFYCFREQSSEVDVTVLKYNSSGVKQFETKLTENTSYISRTQAAPGAITVDVDGNVYCNITVERNSRWQTCVVKLNSSGSYQWINTFEYSQNTDMRANAIHTDLTGSYYVGTGQNPFTMSKLPGAGNLTGTFSLQQYNLTISTNPWLTASSTSAYSNLSNASTGFREYPNGGADHSGSSYANIVSLNSPHSKVLT